MDASAPRNHRGGDERRAGNRPNDPNDGPNDPVFTPLTLTDDLGTVYRRTAGSAYFRPHGHGTVRFEPAPPLDASRLVTRTKQHVATVDRDTGRLARGMST